jgi:hypothetical protein
MKLKKIPFWLTGYILFLNMPAYANPLGLNPEDLTFCSKVRDDRARDIAAHSSNTNVHGQATIFTGFGSGSVDVNTATSSSSDNSRSQYQAKNCDTLLQQAGQVNIAELNAEKETAIARMKTQAQVEIGKYSEDTKRMLANINLAGRQDDNRTNLAGLRDTNRTTVNNNIITSGANLIAAIVQSNVNRKAIDAQVEIARLTADPNLALIKNWQLETTSCDSSTVSILIDNKTYCTKATNWLKAGIYTYLRTEDRLQPMSQQPNLVNTNTSNLQPTIQQVSQPSTPLNTNTNSNPQSANESGL